MGIFDTLVAERMNELKNGSDHGHESAVNKTEEENASVKKPVFSISIAKGVLWF